MIFDQLVCAIIRLDIIAWLKAVLPLWNLVLKYTHQQDLPLFLLQVVINYFKEHHPFVFFVVLDEYSHIDKVRLLQRQLSDLSSHVHICI